MPQSPQTPKNSYSSVSGMEDQPDGSLIVRFRAGGVREMAWHLFTWGNTVRIIKPARLKKCMANLAAQMRNTTRARQSAGKGGL